MEIVVLAGLAGSAMAGMAMPGSSGGPRPAAPASPVGMGGKPRAGGKPTPGAGGGGGTPGAGGIFPVSPRDAGLNHISQEFEFRDLLEATGNFDKKYWLGSGSSGTVYRGCLRDGTEVAVKAIRAPKEGGFQEEVLVLSKFRHPNIVVLLGFARHKTERFLVQELLKGGSLKSRLQESKTSPMPFFFKDRLSVAKDVSLGLSHLHNSKPRVFHRDIKTDNILMDRNGIGKVADFGLACLAQPHQKSLLVHEARGTIGYADPEYLRSGVITEKSEVYSFGMVMLELITGNPPALRHRDGRIDYLFEHIRGDVEKVYPMVDRSAEFPLRVITSFANSALQSISEHEQLRPSFVNIVEQLRTLLRSDDVQNSSASSAAGHSSNENYHPARGNADQLAGDDLNKLAFNPAMVAVARQHRQEQAADRSRQQQQAVARGAESRHAPQKQRQTPRPAPAQHGGGHRPSAEELVKQITDMGFTRDQAVEASKRCSSVEACLEWMARRWMARC